MCTVEIKSEAISIDKRRMSGAPVFTGTRVPIRSLFDYLDGNHTLDDFLKDFPSVGREQVHQVLQDASSSLQEIADLSYRVNA